MSLSSFVFTVLCSTCLIYFCHLFLSEINRPINSVINEQTVSHCCMILFLLYPSFWRFPLWFHFSFLWRQLLSSYFVDVIFPFLRFIYIERERKRIFFFVATQCCFRANINQQWDANSKELSISEGFHGNSTCLSIQDHRKFSHSCGEFLRNDSSFGNRTTCSCHGNNLITN